jgi:hypothetical protein
LDRFRVLVREGKITIGNSRAPDAPDARLTFGAFCDIYIRDHVERPEHSWKGQRLMKWHIKTLRSAAVPAASSTLPLEEIPLSEINRSHVEAVRREALTRPADKGGRVGAKSTPSASSGDVELGSRSGLPTGDAIQEERNGHAH